MTRYRVTYRRDLTSRRYYVTVTARDADEARVKAAIRDPEYLSSIQVKNEGPIRELVMEKRS
jgi:hypothetical protein